MTNLLGLICRYNYIGDNQRLAWLYTTHGCGAECRNAVSSFQCVTIMHFSNGSFVSPMDSAALCFIHGVTEHMRRYDALCLQLAESGILVFGQDLGKMSVLKLFYN